MSDSEIMQSEEEEVASSESSGEEEMKEEVQKQEGLVILQEQNDKHCGTYIFNNEDHTLGNLLRTVLSGHPEVEFVGYSIPHPSQPKMNLRLQTLNKDSNQVLNEGLRTVEKLTKILRDRFTSALNQMKQ